MAQGTGSTFGQLKILLGDGATPTEGFTPICGVTQKDISYDSDTVETEMPDCSDEDLPAYKNVGVKAVSVKIDCSGKWTKESHGKILDWWKLAGPKNVKVQYVQAAVGDTEYIAGPAILANLKHSVGKGANVDGSFSLMFTAMPTFTDKS